MTVKLVLNNRTVRCIQENLGAERVTIVENNYTDDGDKYIQFEVETWLDVLHLIHAGQDSGLELGMYGIKGDPKKAA